MGGNRTDNHFQEALLCLFQNHVRLQGGCEGGRWAGEMLSWYGTLVLGTPGDPPRGIPKTDWTEEDHCLLAEVTTLCMAWRSRTGPKGGDLHLAGFLLELFGQYWTYAYVPHTGNEKVLPLVRAFYQHWVQKTQVGP
jgi:hypothetical protein